MIDGVAYIPIVPKYSYLERLRKTMSWEVSRDKLIPMAVKIVEEIRPDIIQVFGSEWCWGQVQLYTNIPVVIHMQGSIPPYYNARLPPNYSELDIVRYNGLNLRNNSYHGCIIKIQNMGGARNSYITVCSILYGTYGMG